MSGWKVKSLIVSNLAFAPCENSTFNMAAVLDFFTYTIQWVLLSKTYWKIFCQILFPWQQLWNRLWRENQRWFKHLFWVQFMLSGRRQPILSGQLRAWAELCIPHYWPPAKACERPVPQVWHFILWRLVIKLVICSSVSVDVSWLRGST